MQLRLITVALDPATGEFPTEPLAGVEGELLSVVEHFFHHHGLPHLLLVVHYRSPSEKRGAKRKRPRENPADALSAVDRELFEKLRAWRRGRAEADGVPAYVVLKNRDLAKVAQRRPSTLAALQDIEGIGSGKAERYGRQVLEVVAEGRGPGGEMSGVENQEETAEAHPSAEGEPGS